VWDSISKAFANPLVQSLTVALVTGVLTGILVPVVKGKVDAQTGERQKRLEAALARQTRVIETQSDLLRETADALWSLRMSMLKVAYYWQEGQHVKAEAAWQHYEEGAWDLFAKFRTEISRSARVSTPNAHDRLRRLYYDTLIPLDERLGRTQRDQLDGKHPDWNALYTDIFGTISDDIEAALLALGRELQLSA